MMKVVVDQKNIEHKKFPRLMKSDKGRVVLFVSDGCGVLIQGRGADVPRYADDWLMEYFEDFNGSVTLSND